MTSTATTAIHAGCRPGRLALAGTGLPRCPPTIFPGVVEAEIVGAAKGSQLGYNPRLQGPHASRKPAFCKRIEQLRGELALGKEHATLGRPDRAP